MKDNIEDYRKNGFIQLDQYFQNNPSYFTYPYYIDGYDEDNFWALVKKGGKEKYIYVKPRINKEENTKYNTYSELVYSELLKQVGIDTASFDIAKFEGNDSTISPNILDDYSENLFIINGSELLDGKRYFNTKISELDDLIDEIHNYARAEFIDKEQEEKAIEDIKKVCIADIFTLTTDRSPHDFDFIVGKDECGKEILKLAPLCHNTYALGSNFSEEEIYDMLNDEDMLADRVELCYSDTGVPESKRDLNYPYWEDTLYYLIEENKNMLDFARNCAIQMDLSKAINNVEEKIEVKIPIEYKEFMYEIWSNRLQNICECIDIDYYKIIDKENIEMEEI